MRPVRLGVAEDRQAIDEAAVARAERRRDVGGFDVGQSSKLTWMQITSLSWRYSDSMTLALGYKFLDVKREVGDNTIELQLRGPFIATFVRF